MKLVILTFKKCLFLREREKERESEHEWGGGCQREGDRGSEAGFALTAVSLMLGSNL